MFAGLDQVHEQVVKIQWMLGQRLVQRVASLDVALDRQYELLHGRLVVADADDLERLHHRNAGIEHRGELAGEQRDILGGDLAFALEQVRLFADPGRGDALLAQVRSNLNFVTRKAPAFETIAFLVFAFPEEGRLLGYGKFGHVFRFPVSLGSVDGDAVDFIERRKP